LTKAVNGATGIALLPFIDHGSTHKSGPYRQNVAAGLQFLVARMGEGGSLWEPDATMYSHALGILALCEDLRISGEVSGQPAEPPSLPMPTATGKKGVRPATISARPNRSFKTSRQSPQQQRE